MLEKNRFQLVPPYMVGTGENLSEVILFLDTSHGRPSIGDILWVQEHSFYVQFIKDVEDDCFEKYSRVTSRSIVNSAAHIFELNFNEPLEALQSKWDSL